MGCRDSIIPMVSFRVRPVEIAFCAVNDRLDGRLRALVAKAFEFQPKEPNIDF